MSNDDFSSMNRRKFLGSGLLFGFAGLASSPLEMLAKIVADDIIKKAQAQESGLLPARNYVNLLLPGAPSRFVFDQWLQTDPASTLNVLSNPMNKTALLAANGKAIDATYSTFNYGGLLVPQFFQHNVVSGSGQIRPLTSLLDNMLVIRGYGTGFDGHSNNVTAQSAPLGGSSSITGVAADYSKKTFQALQFPPRGSFGNFNSTSGKALNIVDGGRPLHELLSGFGAPAAKIASLLNRQQAAIDLTRARLQTYAKSGFIGSTALAKNMVGATELMKKGISDLDGYWDQAVQRYTKAFQDSARMTGLAGFSDMTLVPNPADKKWQIHVSEGDRPVMPIGDMVSIIQNFLPPAYLIEGFALAEYVLTQGLVTSLELMIPTDDPKKIILSGNTTDGNGTVFSYKNDMHASGAIATVIQTSTLFRGISAAILELANKLKETQANGSDLWSQTVFQISSDFGRVGRNDGAGSDHGFNSMVTSIFSGAIQKPMVVGNILQSNGGMTGYDGTHGIKAPIDGYNQKDAPSAVMMASTVTQILGVERNPFSNVAAPLTKNAGGEVTYASSAAKGKMVASQ